MGYGSNEGVRQAEDDFREQIAQESAKIAAGLVAAGDMSRGDAINAVVRYQQYQKEASGDITRTIETLKEAQRPEPSGKISTSQIAAIADELIDDVRDAMADV